ncbi:MAG TPA: isoamylase [Herpetosiphonaceae bacterium]
MNRWTAIEGTPAPLGCAWIEAEQAYNFALYSRFATGVTLLLYGADDFENALHSVRLHHLVNKTGRIWHCRVALAAIGEAQYYAYHIDGPFDPAAGHRFDPLKVLLDPYAPAVFFPPRFSREAAKRPGSNVGQAPLGVLPSRSRNAALVDEQPRHTSDTIIYELHVRGFTQHATSGVSPERRGTYAGLIEKIPYLQELGVTVVELLPVFQFDPQEGNYWGYMPIHFFSPHQQYAAGETPQAAIEEFRQMVQAFHAAGIEVILDVVYNHTGEGDAASPTYSFRGIDNHTYYLVDLERGTYLDDAGTGNVLRCAAPAVRKLIIESMRCWVRGMGIDGFRFDLASILTRNSDGSVNLDDPAVITDISADPDFTHLRLIAEAWDISSYQLGRSFPGITWLQWNGQFRDDLRSFVKGDPGYVPQLMSRLYGSDSLFPDDLTSAYHAYQSVNFITSHDGFCLYDLVAYNQKHNGANGADNQDGPDDNRSWNCGTEGDDDLTPAILTLRKRQIKNFFSLLMLSNGTPMFCAGDEFMHTQRGNNNPYNQDNEITWLDWSRLETNRDMFRFFKLMIAFRKAHPSLGRSRFWRDDVRWYGVRAQPDMSYHSHSLAFYLRGASQDDQDIYVMINAYWEPLVFTIQEGHAHEWRRVVDTLLPSPDDIASAGEEQPLTDQCYTVGPRSVVVLLRP